MASQQIDDNRRTINSNEAFILDSPWTFAAATTGAIGQHTIFTVTGSVLVNVFGIVDTDLVGATATISVGTANNVDGLIAVTTATDMDDGEVWQDATPTVELGAALGNAIPLNDGADITADILTAAISAGVVDFYCLWRPLSEDGDIEVTIPA